MNAFTEIFLAALAVYVSLRVWLGARQIAHLSAHRGDVPEALRQSLSHDLLATATDYAIAKTRLEIAAACLDTIFLLIWTAGGALDLLDRTWRTLGLPAFATGAAVIASSLLLMEGFRLPVIAYRVFAVEQRFGLNRVTPSLFLTDAARKGGLLLAASLPLAVPTLWLMEGVGAARWLAVWGLWTAFQLTRIWAYPTLVSPLFNRVAPLPEGDLRARLTGLMARSGYVLHDVMIMDGSRRSSHANAHVAGIGRAKRVVLLDTLVEALGPAEIEAVTAHELGHLAHRHAQKYHAVQALIAFGWILIFGWLADQPGFFSGLGVSQPSPHAALALLLVISPVFGLLPKPAVFFMLRRFEVQADVYAARHSDPRSLCQALLRLCRCNVSPLSGHPIYAAFSHSHPLLPARIETLMAAAQGPESPRV